MFLLLFSCTKKQLGQTTITLDQPVDQKIYHKNDTVFIFGNISYEKKVNDIAFFVALDIADTNINFYARTILPVTENYDIREYYINEFDTTMNVTLSYGKRHVKSGQIYEIKTLNLQFVP